MTTRESRPPTMSDVAKEAGVSRSLVSLVVQQPEKVGAARKAAVHEAMARLGYRPNAAARFLAQARSEVVGILVSDLHNPFYTEVIDGIEEVEQAAGHRLLIGSGGRDAARESDVVNGFLELRVEGLILITPRLTNRQIADAAALVPTVVVGRPGAKPRRSGSVHTDDDAGIEMAVDHLHTLGHRRIAHVAAGDGPGARARERGYRSAMAVRGLDDAVQVARAVPNETGGYEGTQRLLQASQRPTAIIASNDYAALGVLAALEDAGLECPRDVSVVGYDNSVLAQIRQVGLTSVNQPRREMGTLAATMLRDLIDDRASSAYAHALVPELVVRRTTAAPGDAVPASVRQGAGGGSAA